jgi:hypothetical protein
MSEQVRYGILPNPYTPGILIDFYGNSISNENSWPNVNGSGAGNLTAETAVSDTSGYHFIDRGSGGIGLNTRGSGSIIINNAGSGLFELIGGASGGGVTIGDLSATGMALTATSGPMLISGAQLGFFSSAGATQQSGGGVTTVAQLVTILRAYGLLS